METRYVESHDCKIPVLSLDAADYDGIGWGVVWPRYWRERGPLPAAADTEANHD